MTKRTIDASRGPAGSMWLREEIELTVEGSSCTSCAARLESTLGVQPGVVDARVNLAANRVGLVFDPEAATLEELVAGGLLKPIVAGA